MNGTLVDNWCHLKVTVGMARIIRMRVLRIYESPDGRYPYIEWMQSLKDLTIRTRIERRVKRITFGNFGDHRRIKESGGVWELRMHFGPGYRVYYGEDGPSVIVLLHAGSKHTQQHDINTARTYWLEYQGTSDES